MEDIGTRLEIICKLTSLGILLKRPSISGITVDFLKEKGLMDEYHEYSEKRRKSEIEKIIRTLTDTEMEWMAAHSQELKDLLFQKSRGSE